MGGKGGDTSDKGYNVSVPNHQFPFQLFIPVPFSTSSPAHLLWVCDQQLSSQIHNLKLHNVILGGRGPTKWEGQREADQSKQPIIHI